MLESSPSSRSIEEKDYAKAADAGTHSTELENATTSEDEDRKRQTTRNRRKTYLDRNPDYYSTDLELADPLLYDRLIRRFQTPVEREAEGRAKGYSGMMQADLLRYEAKVKALASPNAKQAIAYGRGEDGSILPEAEGDAVLTKEEGESRWRQLMTWRFLRGDDTGFDYKEVDENEAYDDEVEQRRDKEDEYFRGEEPSWLLGEGTDAQGETGVQDF